MANTPVVRDHLARSPVEGAEIDIFISYSHDDSELATPLQHGLEQLGRRWNERRALVVYRDSATMGLSPTLWSTLADALDRSRWLLVLASPAARTSPWVQKEVAYWLNTKGPEATKRIMLVLTDGELHWEEQGVYQPDTSTALPEALIDAFPEEPKWADLRRYRDSEGDKGPPPDLDDASFRDDVAEIAAPVHGRSKDEMVGLALEMELRARRVRRYATLALAVLAIAASVAAVLAILNAGRAGRNQQAAEARQLLLQADAASTEVEAMQLAQEAVNRAESAGLEVEPFTAGLYRSTARGDLPFTEFPGIAQPDSSSGGRRGVTVTRDGSHFAFIDSGGTIRIHRSLDLLETGHIGLGDIGFSGPSPFVQLAFDDRRDHLAVVGRNRGVVLESMETGWRIRREFDVDLGRLPTVNGMFDTEVGGAPMAAGLSSDLETLAVLDDRVVLSIIDARSGQVREQLGGALSIADADFVSVALSADQNRICAVSLDRVRYFQLSPPELLADLDAQVVGIGSCWPEGCSGRLDNLIGVDETDTAVCVDPGGADLGSISSGADPVPGLALVRANVSHNSLGVELLSGDRLLSLRSESTASGEVLASPRVEFSVGAEIVRHRTGPMLINHESDGALRLWRLDSGTLLPIERVDVSSDLELGTAVFSPAPGPSRAIAYVDSWADGDTVVISSIDRSSPKDVTFPRVGDVELVHPVSDEELLVVFEDGSTYRVDLQTWTAAVVRRIERADDLFSLTARAGRLVRGVGGRLQVFDLAGDDVEIRMELDLEAANACEVGLSEDTRLLVLVVCEEGRSPQVSVYEVENGERTEGPLPLPLNDASSAAVTADGSTIAVASWRGQVAVRRNGQWIHPPSFLTTSAGHNNFRIGWVHLDPDGHFLVTRRDSQGLELWPLPLDGDRPLGLLAHDYLEFAPHKAQFAGGLLRLTWGWGTGGHLEMYWPAGSDRLAEVVCGRLIPTVAGDRPDGCQTVDEPSLETGPSYAPAEVAVAPLDEFLQPEDVTRYPVAEGLGLTDLDLQGDGVWASGDQGIARLEADGAQRHVPIPYLSAKGVIANPGGSAYVAGSHSLLFAPATGQVTQWNPEGSSVALLQSGERLHYVTAFGGAPGVPVRSYIYHIDKASPAAPWTRSEWPELVVSSVIYSSATNAFIVSGTEGEEPVFFRQSVNGDALGSRVDFGSTEAMVDLVEDAAGTIWFLSEDRTKVGRLDPIGPATWMDLPGSFTARALAPMARTEGVLVAGGRGVLSVTERVGAVWKVKEAVAISAIAQADDGSVWLADGGGDAVFRVRLGPMPQSAEDATTG